VGDRLEPSPALRRGSLCRCGGGRTYSAAAPVSLLDAATNSASWNTASWLNVLATDNAAAETGGVG